MFRGQNASNHAFIEVGKNPSGMPVLRKWTRTKNERKGHAHDLRSNTSYTESDDEQLRRYHRRVFLYLQLQDISDLSESTHRLRLQLKHPKGTVTKLDDSNSSCPSIELGLLEAYKPTFSIVIEQDNVDDLNAFSDHPLLITLQHCSVEKTPDNLSLNETEDDDYMTTDYSDEYDEDNETNSTDELALMSTTNTFETIACGYIDLLEFFTQARAIFTIETVLYPISTENLCSKPCKCLWEIYTIQPLLKHVSYTNIVYITFEAIYNAKPELQVLTHNIRADLYFHAKLPNAQGKYDKVKLCSFGTFTKSIIAEQSIHQSWETINENMYEPHSQSMGGYTGCTVNLYRLFKNLLYAEHDQDLALYKIHCGVDVALVANAMHRYIMTYDLLDAFKNTICFNEQHISIEICTTQQPEEVLLTGQMELPILLYPKINACRFAVQLKPTTEALKSYNPNTIEQQQSSMDMRKTFAIVNICLQTPIVERDELPILSNPNNSNSNDDTSCAAAQQAASHIMTSPEMIKAYYTAFDEKAEELIHRIMQNKVKSADDAKKLFDTQQQDFAKSITTILTADFMERCKTETSKQFANLLTIAYGELVQRVYKIVQNYNPKSSVTYATKSTDIHKKIQQFMSLAKLAYEAGNATLGGYIYNKLHQIGQNDTYWNFCVFLYDVEKRSYTAAEHYLQEPKKNRFAEASYYEYWVTIYLKYVKMKTNKPYCHQAQLFLLQSVKQCTLKYPRDLEAWVLLYCLYTTCRYTPGVSYARFKFENLQEAKLRTFPNVPTTRWRMYLDYPLQFKKRSHTLMHTAMQVFLQLGAYQFAQIIFTQLADKCNELEKYLIDSTFKILLHEMPTPSAKNGVGGFSVQQIEQDELLQSYFLHTAGNLECYQNVIQKAVYYYESILDMKYVSNFQPFELGLLRCAYWNAQHQRHTCVLRALGKCTILGPQSILTYMALGRTMYQLNRLTEAEMYFAQCTQYEMHIPDVWGYLALINLKMGYVVKAGELWKYAKINSENVISDDILREFKAILRKGHTDLIERP